ncbi:pilus assembly protein PilM [Mangrovibacillus cuniculi]|uniref:Pilus assembly protein PilM n=1 Tax=Mangrovibacillus cuniculi TaxID=2593652 RepID=A0A7S8CC50_9BACI|nr:pilus assembly protein PilM [Mangrovibacillus cuniculi]QPC47259.1 pilus assembly protein PilM [Mangrovibacillus cuniculi]
MQNTETIFALDIGTRSVVGVIVKKIEGQYHVEKVIVEEHSERSMLDGQIHDVIAVSNTITSIKETLEETYGELSKVCVAAAGRSLVTMKKSFSKEIKGKPLLTNEDVLHMELSAVQEAQSDVADTDKKSNHVNNYYCVGYSVLKYYIDGQEIGNLVDQRGEWATVEVIATFLPRVVVDSLLSALSRASLQLDALTLEPIAAINALIPTSMRRLNIALVDIGAGTSDIALTKEGTIIAYGMVPTAGDEITEAVSDAFLLDFTKAESVKRSLRLHEEVLVEDVLGFENRIPSMEVIREIKPAVEHLAAEIGKEIKFLNGNESPKAIMLVGGGSLTPCLSDQLASYLELPVNRVAVRGSDAIQHVSFADGIVSTPELVTPVGIALAAQTTPIHYVTVTVNNTTVRLFELNELKVSDCLLASGERVSKLHGKPGLATFITFNGQPIQIPGQHGKPPIVHVNGELATLQSIVKDQDKLTVEKGVDGTFAEIYVKDFLDASSHFTVSVNNEPVEVMPTVWINERKGSIHDPLHDGDNVRVTFTSTIEQLVKRFASTFDLEQGMKKFFVTINGKQTSIPKYGVQIKKNGVSANVSSQLQKGDSIEIIIPKKPTVREVMNCLQTSLEQRITVFIDNKEITISRNLSVIKKNNKDVTIEETVSSGDSITFTSQNQTSFIFQDALPFLSVEKPGEGYTFTLMYNGSPATFDTPIFSGDELAIEWKKVMKV